MTVEQLNIKITADSSNFRNEIAQANTAIANFRTAAKNAGKDAAAAFGGLINTEVTDEKNNISADGTVKTDMPTAKWRSGYNNIGDFSAYLSSKSNTAEVLDLKSSETLVGKIDGSSAGEVQQVDIRTTVELDGDAVGESVNRFNMRRHRITNGSEG